VANGEAQPVFYDIGNRASDLESKDEVLTPDVNPFPAGSGVWPDLSQCGMPVQERRHHGDRHWPGQFAKSWKRSNEMPDRAEGRRGARGAGADFALLG
jgi:hypothetical protein